MHVVEIGVERTGTEDGALDWRASQPQGDLVFSFEVADVDATIAGIEDRRESWVDDVFQASFLSIC